MMNVALEEKNVYEDFEPRSDTLFFKVGSHGLISFHGRNYNIKKKLSAEERNRLLSDSNFYRVASDCYVNVGKISHIEEDGLHFGNCTKSVSCSKRVQHYVMQMMQGSPRVG
ncbi:LytTR family transcriptional regulator DNA-binding domain-containing protein [Cohnella faecalis]|uniref:Uncharacterized protein n=1 Tax=Cohnella faecalis TaxID=2315694 RepID=A0A398CPC4_9BACL|nr:LytTR family transcriptional regulator DNA-binding domain-containing protein [Cohnella faecalis]RIE00784.1 hypothetical protein D3H35_26705 [Cohnella faecalis]